MNSIAGSIYQLGHFEHLLWKVLNQDGISQAGELYTLNDLGVASINVTGTASNINLGGGNTQPFSGSFTKTDGATGDSGVAELAGSLLLSNNNFYREFTDDPALTTEAQALPEMHGSGTVCDLRPAMSLSYAQAANLQSALTQFAAGTTRDQQMGSLDTLIQSWGATSSMTTSVQRRMKRMSNWKREIRECYKLDSFLHNVYGDCRHKTLVRLVPFLHGGPSLDISFDMGVISQ